MFTLPKEGDIQTLFFGLFCDLIFYGDPLETHVGFETRQSSQTSWSSLKNDVFTMGYGNFRLVE